MAQEEVTRLSQEVQALADGSGAARNEHQRLQEELHSRAMEDTEGGEDGTGIGDGASSKSLETAPLVSLWKNTVLARCGFLKYHARAT